MERLQFTPLVERIAAIQRLGDMVAWLPTDEVAIDLRHFRDATIRRPEPADPLAPVAHVTRLLEAASEFHCLVGVAPPLEFERAMRDGVVAGDLTTHHVMTAEELDYLRGHPDRLARWREYVAAGANLYRYDGQVPCNVLVFDDTVLVGRSNSTESGAGALVESENEAVRSWAHELIDRFQIAAERLDPSSLTGPIPRTARAETLLPGLDKIQLTLEQALTIQFETGDTVVKGVIDTNIEVA